LLVRAAAARRRRGGDCGCCCCWRFGRRLRPPVFKILGSLFAPLLFSFVLRTPFFPLPPPSVCTLRAHIALRAGPPRSIHARCITKRHQPTLLLHLSLVKQTVYHITTNVHAHKKTPTMLVCKFSSTAVCVSVYQSLNCVFSLRARARAFCVGKEGGVEGPTILLHHHSNQQLHAAPVAALRHTEGDARAKRQ
jgi:hypothetical protein